MHYYSIIITDTAYCLLHQPAMSSYIIYREEGRSCRPGVGSQWMAFSGINLLKIKSFVLGPDWLHHISIMGSWHSSSFRIQQYFTIEGKPADSGGGGGETQGEE